MSPTEELLAPPTLPPPEENKWRSEQRAFHRLLPDLLKTHHGQFVAIHNGQVVERPKQRRARRRCGTWAEIVEAGPAPPPT